MILLSVVKDTKYRKHRQQTSYTGLHWYSKYHFPLKRSINTTQANRLKWSAPLEILRLQALPKERHWLFIASSMAARSSHHLKRDFRYIEFAWLRWYLPILRGLKVTSRCYKKTYSKAALGFPLWLSRERLYSDILARSPALLLKCGCW